MHRIVRKQVLAEKVVRFEIEAPLVARKRKAGQFVIVRANEVCERVPLTLVDSDPQRGTITLIIQEVGASTHILCSSEEGEAWRDVVGPLGRATEIKQVGRVGCVAGGIGTAVAYPIAKAMKEAGNEVVTVIGARRADLLILLDEMAAVSHKLVLATEDGSKGMKGLVTDALRQELEGGTRLHQVLAIGPVPMMRAVCEVTREFSIPTLVSLNPIMIDGTGMCGGCRVEVGGQTRFACVEGPEFDGHQVDFDLLARRLRTYQREEKIAGEQCKLHPEYVQLLAQNSRVMIKG